MIQRGIASFGLDYGKCPPWLFERMVKLGREMMYVLVAEYGPDEFIKRIADPAYRQILARAVAQALLEDSGMAVNVAGDSPETAPAIASRGEPARTGSLR